MASGNFLIGEGISSEGFNKYVKPYFSIRDISIPDMIFIREGYIEGLRDPVLISIVGKEDLEEQIANMSIELRLIVEKTEGKDAEEQKKQGAHYNPVAWPHQFYSYKKVGFYSNNDTASNLFPSIAQEYLLSALEGKAGKVEKTIKGLLS
jgi:hypothetical protein